MNLTALMWATRCRMVYPDDTTDLPSRKKASDEHTSELNQSGRNQMPITRRSYMGLTPQKRKPLLTQWTIAFPATKRDPLDNWVKRKEGPERLSRAGRIIIKRAAEAARRKAQRREAGGDARARLPDCLQGEEGKTRAHGGGRTPRQA